MTKLGDICDVMLACSSAALRAFDGVNFSGAVHVEKRLICFR